MRQGDITHGNVHRLRPAADTESGYSPLGFGWGRRGATASTSGASFLPLALRSCMSRPACDRWDFVGLRGFWAIFSPRSLPNPGTWRAPLFFKLWHSRLPEIPNRRIYGDGCATGVGTKTKPAAGNHASGANQTLGTRLGGPLSTPFRTFVFVDSNDGRCP